MSYFLSTRELINLLIIEILIFCISEFTNHASDVFFFLKLQSGNFWFLGLFGFVFRKYLYRFYSIFTAYIPTSGLICSNEV